MTTAVAPWARASASASIVSRVAPLCVIAMATSRGPSRAALVSAMWVSDEAKATRPIRCSFCWKSAATNALAPTP